MSNYKLSPSDLTFTWDGCPFCFYMKVKHGIQVRTPFPGMFSKMANLTSGFYHGKSSREIWAGLPEGTIKYKEQFVKSKPIPLPGTDSQCYLFGRFDAVIAFVDGTYGIVDYKTSDASEEHAAFYSRQLTAYAYALENPAPGALSLAPVSLLGLYIITPESYLRTPEGQHTFTNKATWMEVPRDDGAFLTLLTDIVKVLDLSQPPEPSMNCGLCNYRSSMGDFTSMQG